MTNSAQVSFTFFTNCTDEQYRSFGLDLLILNGLRKRDQSDRSQPSSAMPGASNRLPALTTVKSVSGQHCIEVRTDDEQRR